MPRTRIDRAEGSDAVRAVRAGNEDSDLVALATRYLLQCLAESAPGRSVELRVPPYGATQLAEGPGHTRGTPPNVIETDPLSWLALATGDLAWSSALRAGRVIASGTRADLTSLLPVAWE